ncbi:MAG: TonB-dependent receptor domain-containing protein [bacterium]
MSRYSNYLPRTSAVAMAIALAAAWPAAAQEAAPAESAAEQSTAAEGPIEELVVIGRYRSAATDVVSERIDSAVAVDLLDAESISRLGDSDVAAALRRVPGLTVADDKFVYVRGLGERYSSAQLNGATVPSPDLTRNVVPLDIFPAQIIDALAVQKGYSPELPAAFGGGNVDIRTKRIPEDRVFSIGIKTGWNSDSDNGFTYSGGGDDKWGKDDGTRSLPNAIAEGIQTYQGNFSISNIFNVLRRDGQFHTVDEAVAINQDLATALNRDFDLREKSLDPDLSAEIVGGYRWFLSDELEAGFLAQAAYDNAWRNKERTNRRIANPDTDFSVTERTINSVNITGTLNLGLRFTEDHEIGTVTMFLRNTEDEAASTSTCQQGQFNDCADPTNPTQGRIDDIRFEQRDLRLNQVSGSHTLGAATLERLPEMLGFAELVQNAKFTWYYSDAKAEADIPGELRVGSVELLDPASGGILSRRIRSTASAAEYVFSDLEDDVESYGYDVMVPFSGDGWDLEMSGGFDYSRKGRSFRQYRLGLGSTSPGFLDVSSGLPSEVFSDANISDPANGIELVLGIGSFGTESYFAGQIVDASYGKFDLLWNDTWRISGGARWENFQQVSVPVNLLAFSTPRIPLSAEEIASSAINEDDWYPALAVTYIRPGFWSDEFQLRFGWSETAARPDLREISRSTYIDPLTEARVRGNPFLVPSALTNYDVRAEWFWNNGDNFTVSLFYKDIDRPIETVQGDATEDNVVFGFINADKAEVYGLEVEWLKGLGFASRWVGGWVDTFYLAGNVTLSDSEIDISPGSGGGVGNITNPTRRLSQQSDWVANLQLGYDSPNGKHGATLVYNAFGERIFFAGINGFDDAFEQPFHSLDVVYSYFATENLTVKFRVKNLLNDSVEIKQQGVTVIEQDIGATALVDVKWEL